MGRFIKVLGVLLIVGLLVSPCFATQRVKTNAEETLTKTTTDTGWEQYFVGNAKKVTFFITLDSSSTTSSVTVGVTLQASADGTNWTDISWFDIAGGTTKQTDETMGSLGDETYIMWTDKNILMPHIRIKVYQAGNWDTQTGGVTISIVEDK